MFNTFWSLNLYPFKQPLSSLDAIRTISIFFVWGETNCPMHLSCPTEFRYIYIVISIRKKSLVFKLMLPRCHSRFSNATVGKYHPALTVYIPFWSRNCQVRYESTGISGCVWQYLKANYNFWVIRKIQMNLPFFSPFFIQVSKN